VLHFQTEYVCRSVAIHQLARHIWGPADCCCIGRRACGSGGGEERLSCVQPTAYQIASLTVSLLLLLLLLVLQAQRPLCVCSGPPRSSQRGPPHSLEPARPGQVRGSKQPSTPHSRHALSRLPCFSDLTPPPLPPSSILPAYPPPSGPCLPQDRLPATPHPPSLQPLHDLACCDWAAVGLVD